MQHGGADYIVYAGTVSNDWLCLSVFDATAEFGQLRNMLLFTILAVLLVVSVLFFILLQLSRKQEQIARLGIHAVEAIAEAIDAKDSYTKGHSDRVANYAKEIGRRYGYSEKQQDELYMMGLLHDVGKIGVPDAVINKPGKLTDEEFSLIKKHPVIGWQILCKTKELARLAMGTRWHHEKFDGAGYPDRIAENDIPEEARIIAVADAYDAMTSRRSYRDVLTQDVVRKEIEKGKGTQFDPAFADIMLQMIDEDHDYRMRDR
ncbi:MAG: HD-GYP domain-containing protein [Schwartzia sp.]|nr:HD-GYP domain-containing protein [Schwartzia sp. (in: firmicutes)]